MRIVEDSELSPPDPGENSFSSLGAPAENRTLLSRANVPVGWKEGKIVVRGEEFDAPSTRLPPCRGNPENPDLFIIFYGGEAQEALDRWPCIFYTVGTVCGLLERQTGATGGPGGDFHPRGFRFFPEVRKQHRPAPLASMGGVAPGAAGPPVERR